MKRIGIIGAGAAGLCSLKHALSKDYVPLVWEHSSSLGGTWKFTPSTGTDEHGFPIHSSMYNSLRTNLPKEIMNFPDFPFEENENSFLHHSEVLKYLNDYTDYFNLRPWIKFNHHVDWIEPVDEENRMTDWRVTVRNLEDNTSSDIQCDALIICNGHYSVPKYPSIENLDSFVGKQSHSHDYRVPEPFTDKTVIVLGASASGMDIALETSTVAKKVYLSHNLPIPIPSDLPKNVEQVKGIVGATANGFILTDGTSVQVDEIIYCTGYEFVFPFLSPACGIRVKDDQVQPLYKHLININFPSMAFIGIPTRICPFPVFYMQVQFCLKAFGKLIDMPTKEEMEADTASELSNKVKHGAPSRLFHRMGNSQWEYCNRLANEGDFAPLVPVIEKIYKDSHERRHTRLLTYKQNSYFICGPDSFQSKFGHCKNLSFKL